MTFDPFKTAEAEAGVVRPLYKGVCAALIENLKRKKEKLNTMPLSMYLEEAREVTIRSVDIYIDLIERIKDEDLVLTRPLLSLALLMETSSSDFIRVADMIHREASTVMLKLLVKGE